MLFSFRLSFLPQTVLWEWGRAGSSDRWGCCWCPPWSGWGQRWWWRTPPRPRGLPGSALGRNPGKTTKTRGFKENYHFLDLIKRVINFKGMVLQHSEYCNIVDNCCNFYSFRTTGPISIKLHTKHPWVKVGFHKDYSIFKREIMKFILFYHGLV